MCTPMRMYVEFRGSLAQNFSLICTLQLVFVYRHHYPSDEQVKKLKIPAEALAKVYLLPLGSIAGKTATRIAPPATSSLVREVCVLSGLFRSHLSTSLFVLQIGPSGARFLGPPSTTRTGRI